MITIDASFWASVGVDSFDGNSNGNQKDFYDSVVVNGVTIYNQKEFFHSNVVCSVSATLQNIGKESLALNFTTILSATINYKINEEIDLGIDLTFQLSGTQSTDHVLITVLPSGSTSRIIGSNSF